MANVIFDDGKIAVNSFTGPGKLPGPHRIRYQITIDNKFVTYTKKELLAFLVDLSIILSE